MINRNQPWFYLFSLLVWAGALIFSYTRIDVNLTLIAHPLYQTWHSLAVVWSSAGHPVPPTLYAIIVLAVFSLFYIGYRRQLFQSWWALSLAGIALFMYPGWSHDIFNYIFNAKMVWVYGANPHVSTAMMYPNDLWTRFMHNVHTPAPYFYGWTGLSLVPFIAGFGKFTLTLFLFKLYSLISWLAVGYTLKRWFRLTNSWLYLLMLNPLVLIEIIGNGHNDLWMMWFALIAFFFAHKSLKAVGSRRSWLIIASFIFLLMSASIKYATLVLLPLMLFWWFKPSLLNQLKLDCYTFASLLLFLLLFLPRSQFFHPWYLTWALVPAALGQNKPWFGFLLSLSLGALLRYLPFFYYADYTPLVNNSRIIITFSPAAIYVFWYYFKHVRQI